MNLTNRYGLRRWTSRRRLIQYHTRDRLDNHFSKKSPRCLQPMQRIFQPLSDDVVARLDADAVVVRKQIKTSRIPISPSVMCLGPYITDELRSIGSDGSLRRRFTSLDTAIKDADCNGNTTAKRSVVV